MVCVYTGMRWEIQFSLVWAQIDLKRLVIHLWSTKDPTGRVQMGLVSLPLNSVALAAMKKQQKLVPHQPTDSGFTDAGDYCRFWFEPCLKEPKIDNYTWHCNLHTFCSRLAIDGVSMKAIQARLPQDDCDDCAIHAPCTADDRSRIGANGHLNRLNEHAPKQAPGRGHSSVLGCQITTKLFSLCRLCGAPGEIRTPDLLIRSQIT